MPAFLTALLTNLQASMIELRICVRSPLASGWRLWSVIMDRVKVIGFVSIGICISFVSAIIFIKTIHLIWFYH
ncbi:unnamed protein product [Blepharisma stoltei]|uniref:Uncharacterized protein n=1 Tax=Blepharisma stoltei TaxID=1481888 RepID=A0AAU9JY93_9CILI|nr:unnamed protein product [Blepharisma stoltei]